MIRPAVAFALLGVVAACSAPRGSDGAASPSATYRTTVYPLALEPPPVYAIIGYRDRLDLTSAQVTALDSIATEVRAENSPLIDELEDKAITSNRSPGVLQVNPDDRPLLDRIRANNQRAIERVQELLSEEQREEVCGLYEDEVRADERREQDASRRRAPAQTAFSRGPARDLAADSSLVVRGFTAWPWCRSGGGGTGGDDRGAGESS